MDLQPKKQRNRSLTPFNITFPNATGEPDQDQEVFEFDFEGGRRRLRVHDYDKMYDVPGLYEALVYKKLRCRSPRRIVQLLTSVIQDWPREPKDLRVLDLGAGNGIVAERLRDAGVEHIVGLDLLPEARDAAERDRPDVYDDYLVADLTDLSDDDVRRLEKANLNTLITVAALGFGDIPPRAFANAFNFVEPTGWIAMTIKEDFLEARDPSGFSRLLRAMIDDGLLDVQAHQRYCHRRSIAGEKLFYVILVGRKSADVPEQMIKEAETPAAKSVTRNGEPESVVGAALTGV